MTSNQAPAQPRNKRGGWKFAKWLGGMGGLLVAIYFVTTSEAFLKAVVMPRVGKNLGGKLTAGSISLSPFSSLRLVRAGFVPAGHTEPLLTVDELYVEHDLFAIMGGKIKLGRVEMKQPRVRLAKAADGSSNYDPVLKALEGPETKSQPIEAAQLDLANISLAAGSLEFTTALPDGGRQILSLGGLNLSIDRLANAAAVIAKIESTLDWSGPTNDNAQAEISGDLRLALDGELRPGNIKSQIRLAVSGATRMFTQFDGLAADLTIDARLPEIRSLELQFSKSGQALGGIALEGRFDPITIDADLQVETTELDHRVLNLAGLLGGMDFTDSKANVKTALRVVNGGNLIEAGGTLNGTGISVKIDGDPTPAMDIELDYETRIDLAAKHAHFTKLQFTGVKGGKKQIGLHLRQPMTLAWAGNEAAFEDSLLKLDITGVDLAEWRMLFGRYATGGTVGGTAELHLTGNGRRFRLLLDSKVKNIELTNGAPRLNGTDLLLKARGSLEDWSEFDTEEFRLAFDRGTTTLVDFGGLVSGRLGGGDAPLEFTVKGGGRADLSEVAELAAIPDFKAKKGHAEYSATLDLGEQSTQFNADVSITGFTGGYNDWRFDGWDAVFDTDATLAGETLGLKQVDLQLLRNSKPQGRLSVSGDYPLAQGAGRLEFRASEVLAELLQAVLGPWFLPAKITSGQAETVAVIIFNPDGSLLVDVDGTLAQLMLEEDDHPLLASLTSLVVKNQTRLAGDNIDLAGTEIALPESARAANRIALQGRLAAPAEKPVTGNLKLTSDAIDIGSLLELVPGEKAGAVGSSQAEENFAQSLAGIPGLFATTALDLQVELAKAFWQELVITQASVTGKVGGQMIELDPVKFEVNGMPVKGRARIDTHGEAPSYSFEIEAKDLAVQSIVDAFEPEAKGTIAGKVTLLAKLQSKGNTDAEFWKNLTGESQWTFSEGDLRLLSPDVKLLLMPVAILLRLPELLNSPIDSMHVKASFSGRKMNLEKTEIHGLLFVASTIGEVPLRETLSDSPLNLPVAFSLRRDLAEKAGLLSRKTPLQATHVRMPDFITIEGTLGEPKTRTNKLKILSLLGKSAVGLTDSIEARAGGLLEDVTDIFSGEATGKGVADVVGDTTGDIIKGIGGLIPGLNKLNRNSSTNKLPEQPFGIWPKVLPPKK